MNLYQHQQKVLDEIKGRNRVLLALEMGLGKTLVATEHLKTLNYEICLIVCPKSLISMWKEHFMKFYNQEINDYTKTKKLINGINIVNYDLIFRRKDLIGLKNATLILDEVNAIVNPSAKRTKVLMKMEIDNLIMLSGSIGKGRYENLYVLAKMLNAQCTKKQFYDRYVIQREIEVANSVFPIKIITGYKNIDELRSNMIKRGTVFMKTEEAVSLPDKTFIDLSINPTKDYKNFKKDRIITLNDGTELVGDCTLNQMLYERYLCGVYNKDKLIAFKDLIDSTDDRLIVFYNFWNEYNELVKLIDRPLSVINGKERDMENYNKFDNSITLIQYASGSAGINAQKANKIIYFTPPLSCEFYSQSKKRIHRIGQEKPCFYYRLIVESSIENKIYKALQRGEDYTELLFKKDEANG